MVDLGDEVIRVRARVTGRVQGVFFRQSARHEAMRLGVAGFARNEPDGAVLVEAEGDRAAVDALIAWCHDGPDKAQVDAVVVEVIDPAGGSGFRTG